MGSHKISVALVLFIVAAIFSPSLAQNSPQDYVDAHNAARQEVGVGQITWDDTVAAYAQNYANQRINDCNLQHSGGQYGENLAAGSGSFSGVDGVSLWVNEKANYDPDSNSCVGGQCLHYTQVVWNNSVWLGCARVKCTNRDWWFVICNYDPPGNIVGERPYYNPAQNSIQDFLDPHNAARAQVGVGPMTWDNQLAAYALNYANTQKAKCPDLVHSGGPYGENLAAGTGDFTARQAVALWVGEQEYYDYNTNSCKGGVCGHYTQVVWHNSVRLGCARVNCTKNNWWYVICSYDPAGNYIGQRPYPDQLVNSKSLIEICDCQIILVQI